MPSLSRGQIDTAVLAYFQEVGFDLEATRRRIAENAEQVIDGTRSALVQAERQRAVAEERFVRVRRDYQDGKLDPDDWREQRDELRSERDAAASQVDRLTARMDEVVTQCALLDSEQELLDRLVQLRQTVAGTVMDGATIEAIRVALLRLFDGFTLHCYEHEPAVPPTLPDGWVRSRQRQLHPDLLLPGNGGFLIEPHPRRDMILEDDKEVAFPQLRRVPLEARVRMSNGGDYEGCDGMRFP